MMDGLKRIPAMGPLDFADEADDVLYLPETLYLALLSLIVAFGPGLLSLDAIMKGVIHGL